MRFAATCPGQRTMNGTRVPASKALYLPPRKSPHGLWSPSSSAARTVVAADYEQRIVREAERVERIEHFSHRMVERKDGVAAGPHAAPAREAFVRNARNMDVVGPQVEEERPAAVVGDEPQGLFGYPVRDLLVAPQGAFSALHVADARNAVDDGLVVSVGGSHPQQLGVVASGRLSREGFFVAHGDRVFWVEVHDPLVLDVNARDAVARGGHDEGVVEPDVPQSRSDFAVPLLPGRLSQAEVPFADGAGDVARVYCSGEMIMPASPAAIPVPGFRHGYCPVSRP